MKFQVWLCGLLVKEKRTSAPLDLFYKYTRKTKEVLPILILGLRPVKNCTHKKQLYVSNDNNGNSDGSSNNNKINKCCAKNSFVIVFNSILSMNY